MLCTPWCRRAGLDVRGLLGYFTLNAVSQCTRFPTPAPPRCCLSPPLLPFKTTLSPLPFTPSRPSRREVADACTGGTPRDAPHGERGLSRRPACVPVNRRSLTSSARGRGRLGSTGRRRRNPAALRRKPMGTRPGPDPGATPGFFNIKPAPGEGGRRSGGEATSLKRPRRPAGGPEATASAAAPVKLLPRKGAAVSCTDTSAQATAHSCRRTNM